MDFPKRKQIRLKDYDYSQKNAYFLTICTYHQLHLFGKITNDTVSSVPRGNRNDAGNMIEKWLFELENKFNQVQIDFYVIMPNHIHFIIINTGNAGGNTLPGIIDWFKTMTTNEYIKGVKNHLFTPFNKHLWQRSYYEHVIRNEQDLNGIRQYIEENPLKWSLDEYYKDDQYQESGMVWTPEKSHDS